MGTRGLYCFRYKGRLYRMFRRWDSYPSGLGVQLVEEIKEAIKNGTFEQWKVMLDKIKVVDLVGKPTADEIKALSKYRASKEEEDDDDESQMRWYTLLYGC